jgi:putative adhesin
MHTSLRLIAALGLLLPLAAQAATRVDERAPLGAGGRVELSNIAGKVSVRGWDRNEVALSGSMADGLTLKQDRSTNRVRWEVVYPRNGNNGGATLELRVPRAVEVQLGTVSADIDVAEVDVRRLQANAVSGDIAATGRSGETALTTVSGSIRSQVQTPRLDLRAVSGSVQATGGSGEVAAETVSGSIKLDAGRVQRLGAEAVSEA